MFKTTYMKQHQGNRHMKKNIIQTFEVIHNTLSDQDWVWWPFLFLKPKKDQKITQILIFKMIPCFSIYMVLFRLIMSGLFNGVLPSSNDILKTFVTAFVFFFIWFNVITATLWNRRAERLKKISTPMS